MNEYRLPRDLGGGLTLRFARPDDTDALCDFNAAIHEDDAVRDMSRDLMEGRLTGTDCSSVTLVEEAATGRIVSSSLLIAQVWAYDGEMFGVGRPELVGTAPEYRRRGLVRAQMDALHALSQSRGDLMQAITGIPNYYRQFGYEMAVDLGGGRAFYQANVPTLPEGQSEPFTVREAVETDAPFLLDLYQASHKRNLLWCRRDEALFRYEISRKRKGSATYHAQFIIERAGGERVGALSYLPNDFYGQMIVMSYELKGASYWEATPSVMRWLWAEGERAFAGRKQPFTSVRFGGGEHPVFQAYPERLPVVQKPYAWYLRVPDVAALVRKVAPALERRLVGSVVEGYTGTVRFTFYTSGLSLTFEKGKLVDAVNVERPGTEGNQASFPGLTFLQALFGYRSVDELRMAFADCYWDPDKAGALLHVLFPKQTSRIWPLD